MRKLVVVWLTALFLAPSLLLALPAPDTSIQAAGEEPSLVPALWTSAAVVDVGEDVSFDASGSSGSIMHYYFDFGDGTNSGWISSHTTSHTFATSGNFSIGLKLKATDGNESDFIYVDVEVVEGGVSDVEGKEWNWMLVAVVFIVIAAAVAFFALVKDKKDWKW